MIRKWGVVATLVLLALVASVPLWGPGMVNTRGGGDSPFLLQRTHQMLVNLRAGVFPVRWMPDAAYGLGYPFFSYYAALPYYLAGLFSLAGLDLLTALKLVQTLGFVASALAMYAWVRRMTGNRWAAWLAGVAYAFAPFHLVNVYVRGDSLSEFYAFIFYPLVLWGLDRSEETRAQAASTGGRGAAWWWPALAYAGLVVTHNLSALIFSPFALLYLFLLALRAPARRGAVLAHGFLSLGFGLLLSAWYWIPVLAEKGVVQTGTLTAGYFHYVGHFRGANLVQRRWLFDYRIGPGADTPFAMGLVQAAVAGLGVLALALCGLRRRLEARWGFALLGLVASTAMITPLSKPVWDRVPLLPLVQFPWRFLSVQALFAAVATAAVVTCSPRFAARFFAPSSIVVRRLPAILASSLGALLALSTLLSLHPDRLPIGPGDVTVERQQLYELFTDNIGTSIRYEYLHQATVPRPSTSDLLIEPGAAPRAMPVDGASLEAVLLERGPVRQLWRVWGEGGRIAFPLLYWPGWGAQVDGTPVDVWPVEGSGYLALELPPGDHRVLLRLGRTPVRAVAEGVSLVALLALVVLVARAGTAGIQASGVKRGMATGLLGLGLCAVGLLVAVLTSQAGDLESETDLTMDFIQMPYLHHNPGGVDFDGVARLGGYALSADELAPGDLLTVTLDWLDVGGAERANLRLVSPAAVRYKVEPLATAALSLRPDQVVSPISLRVPEDISRGVYLLQLRVSGPDGRVHARTAGGNSQGTLYLRPVRVTRGPSLPSDVPVLARFGPSIRLYSATIAQAAPDRLAVKLAWSAAKSVAANYNLSLRLLDAEERVVAAMDVQPGYGFLPTSLWRVGELVTDQYVLALPADMPPADDCHLQVILYQLPSFAEVGQARVGDFALPLSTPFVMQRPPRSFSLPPLEHRVEVDFGDEVRLAGYELAQGAEALGLTLWWQALRAPLEDYTVFVHLFDAETGALVDQSDAMPGGGAYPTSWWADGEVVSETVRLPLDGVSPGVYRLALGLYDRNVVRLVAVSAGGHRVPDDRLVLPAEIVLER